MLEYASSTAIGSRDENQDRLLVLTNEVDGIYWFAVADGMGGHRCGGQAAEVAITAIERSWLADSHGDNIPDLIRQLISKAHRAVSDLAEKEELRPPQTTLAILVISPFGNYSGISEAHAGPFGYRDEIRFGRNYRQRNGARPGS